MPESYTVLIVITMFDCTTNSANMCGAEERVRWPTVQVGMPASRPGLPSRPRLAYLNLYDRQSWMQTGQVDTKQLNESFPAGSERHDTAIRVVELCSQRLGHSHTSVASPRIAATQQDVFGVSIECGRDELTNTVGRRVKRITPIPRHKAQACRRGHLNDGCLRLITTKETQVRFDHIAHWANDLSVVKTATCRGNEGFGKAFTSVDERSFDY